MTGNRDIARRALDGIPGWSGALLTALKGGLTNATWLAEKAGRRATLKADPAPRGFPFASRDVEADVQRAAAKAGLANAVIHASPTVLLSEYVDGRPWTPGALREPRNLVLLAQALRRVHRLPGTGRRFDAWRAACLYAERIRETGGVDQAGIDAHLDTLQSIPEPEEVCCCHNDVVAANLLATPELRLIDWEYAADNDPMFDLAVVIVQHGLDEAEVSILLDAYAGDAAVPGSRRLRREVRRYRSLAWLWQAAGS